MTIVTTTTFLKKKKLKKQQIDYGNHFKLSLYCYII